MSGKLLWTPDKATIDNSNMMKFINYVNKTYYINISNYDELYDWSINNIEAFWEGIWKFFEIKSSTDYETVLENKSMPDENGNKNIWFKGALLNFAENLLCRKDDRIALISYLEGKTEKLITYKQLYASVAKCAAGFKALGVKKGDRVAAIITNTPEAVIGMLAAASLGAIWSSSSPDFGYSGIIERFRQIEPKVLIAVDNYSYNGKKHSMKDLIHEIAEGLKKLEKVIITGAENPKQYKNDLYLCWHELLDNNDDDIEFEQLPFNYPLYIMYSSGTTGKPKCIVHSAGGTLIQHLKELALHTDVKPEDTIMYYTTTGWMMWNWLISSLAVGASIVLYEGSPAYPDISVLWKIIEKQKINIFGTSPKFLSACQAEGFEPIMETDTSNLQALLSTGSPLSEENFKWVYDYVNPNIRLSSISGGTDIISCFMLGSPICPVYSGEIQVRGLGMKVESYNEKNEPVIEEKGELVCTEIFPSMPIYFWGEDGDRKLYEAYFKEIPGVWKHGDYIKITERGGVVVYGRSDATLNPGGVRIGTAEIYNVVESIEGIKDSLALGIPKDNDVEVTLFVALKDGHILTEEFKKKIQDIIKEQLTPRHCPKKIIQFNEAPVTLNGKKVEIAALKKILGEEVTNEAALKNPDSLKQFENIKTL